MAPLDGQLREAWANPRESCLDSPVEQPSNDVDEWAAGAYWGKLLGVADEDQPESPARPSTTAASCSSVNIDASSMMTVL